MGLRSVLKNLSNSLHIVLPLHDGSGGVGAKAAVAVISSQRTPGLAWLPWLLGERMAGEPSLIAPAMNNIPKSAHDSISIGFIKPKLQNSYNNRLSAQS
jgi:hypothetical protein